MKKILDWMDKRIVYIPILLLSIVLAIVSLILHETNEYWGRATFFFAVAPILYTAFRKALKPIEPYGERDTLKRMMKSPQQRETYRELTGIITIVLLALGVANALIGTLMLVLSTFVG